MHLKNFMGKRLALDASKGEYLRCSSGMCSLKATANTKALFALKG